jgi:4-amino-4-deoxy-L-arabinose transferase-like glycosyltransferase
MALSKKDLLFLTILVVVCLPLFFLGPHFRELWLPDEPRYAAIVRNMRASGDWILLRLNGEIYSEKPPLFFWLLGFSTWLWGSLSTFTLAFPASLAGSSTVIVTYLFGRRLFDQTTGFLGALVLATSALFLGLSQFVRMDTLLVLLQSLALFCFYCIYEEHRAWRMEHGIGREKWIPGSKLLAPCFYTLLGFATLTKGPVGFLIPLLIILLFLIWKRDIAQFKLIRPFPGILIFFFIIGTWLIPALYMGGKEYAQIILVKQNFGRAYESWSHRQPFYFYLKQFPPTYLPWFPFLIAAWFYYFRHPWSTIRGNRQTSFITADNGPPSTGLRTGFDKAQDWQGTTDKESIVFLTLWFAAVFTFFSCISGKLEVYLLPLYPAASLLVGKFWADALNERGVMNSEHTDSDLLPARGRLQKSLSMANYVFFGFCLVVGFILLTQGVPDVKYFPDRWGSVIFLGTGILGIVFLLGSWKKAIFGTVVSFMGILLIYAIVTLSPIIDRDKSARPLGEKLQALRTNEEPVCMYNLKRPEYSFYTLTPIRMLRDFEELKGFLSGKERTFCIMKKADFEELKSDLGVSAYNVGEYQFERKRLVLVTTAEISQPSSSGTKALPSSGELKDPVLRKSYETTIARARQWLDALEVDPIELRKRGIKGKKKLAEILDAYLTLYEHRANPIDQANILNRVKNLVTVTDRPEYHNLDLISSNEFNQDSTSYLRVCYLMEQFSLPTEKYRKQIQGILPKLDEHMEQRGIWQRKVFAFYYDYFSLPKPFLLQQAYLLKGLVANRLPVLKYSKDQIYDLTHEVFVAYDDGRRKSTSSFSQEDRIYLRKILVPLLSRSLAEGDVDLGAELITCLTYLGMHDEPIYLPSIRYLLQSQNKNGSWGRYEDIRTQMGNLVDQHLYLHTTLVVLQSMVETFDGNWPKNSDK